MCEEKIMQFNGRKVEITKTWDEYDPDLCCDGGSYYQPLYLCTSGSEVLLLNDTSCGDFGSRIDAKVCYSDERDRPIARAHYGTMCEESECWTTFKMSEHGFWIKFIQEVLGYTGLPYEQ